jgi:hypothetical protein
MAKDYRVGDKTYYHNIPVTVTEVNGSRVTIEGKRNKSVNGADVGRPFRWTLEASDLELYE